MAPTSTKATGRRIFLDVGAHIGETLEAVLDPTWHFDAIYAFEPVRANLTHLERYADPRLTLVPAGWWTEDTELPIFDPGAIGASIHAQKAKTSTSVMCDFIDASGWLEQHIRPEDTVWLKLNCEGAECDILERLAAGGTLSRIDHILIHFDVEKVPGHEARATRGRELLAQAGVEVCEAREIMFGRSHAAKTANWLLWTEAGGVGRFVRKHPVRWAFRVRQWLYPVKVRLAERRAAR